MRRGLTLIEVLVAMAVLIVGLWGVMRIFAPGLRVAAAERVGTTAARISESAGERVASHGFPYAVVPADVNWLGVPPDLSIEDPWRVNWDCSPFHSAAVSAMTGATGQVMYAAPDYLQYARLARRVIGEPVKVPAIIAGGTRATVTLTFGPVEAGSLELYEPTPLVELRDPLPPNPARGTPGLGEFRLVSNPGGYEVRVAAEGRYMVSYTYAARQGVVDVVGWPVGALVDATDPTIIRLATLTRTDPLDPGTPTAVLTLPTSLIEGSLTVYRGRIPSMSGTALTDGINRDPGPPVYSDTQVGAFFFSTAFLPPTDAGSTLLANYQIKGHTVDPADRFDIAGEYFRVEGQAVVPPDEYRLGMADVLSEVHQIGQTPESLPGPNPPASPPNQLGYRVDLDLHPIMPQKITATDIPPYPLFAIELESGERLVPDATPDVLDGGGASPPLDAIDSELKVIDYVDYRSGTIWLAAQHLLNDGTTVWTPAGRAVRVYFRASRGWSVLPVVSPAEYGVYVPQGLWRVDNTGAWVPGAVSMDPAALAYWGGSGDFRFVRVDDPADPGYPGNQTRRIHYPRQFWLEWLWDGPTGTSTLIVPAYRSRSGPPAWPYESGATVSVDYRWDDDADSVGVRPDGRPADDKDGNGNAVDAADTPPVLVTGEEHQIKLLDPVGPVYGFVLDHPNVTEIVAVRGLGAKMRVYWQNEAIRRYEALDKEVAIARGPLPEK